MTAVKIVRRAPKQNPKTHRHPEIRCPGFLSDGRPCGKLLGWILDAESVKCPRCHTLVGVKDGQAVIVNAA